MWQVTCDIITNTHFWAYTWKQKLFSMSMVRICQSSKKRLQTNKQTSDRLTIIVLVIMSHVTCHNLHVTCHMSHCACHMSYVKCLCWSLGHAEQLLFSCVSSKVSICNYVTCHISPFTCHMLYVKCLCWSLGHAEQLLFSCLCSKVSTCNYVKCNMSHVSCHMSNAYVDPWDMLSNFCFHV